MGRPSAIAPLLLDWLRTPGPDGRLASWKVSELAQAVDAAWTTVAQQLQTLAEAGEVRFAGCTYAPRGTQPRLWRAVERRVVEGGVHANEGVHGAGHAEVAGGPSGDGLDDLERASVDVHGHVPRGDL